MLFVCVLWYTHSYWLCVYQSEKSQSSEDTVQQLQKVICCLPLTNYVAIVQLIRHLRRWLNQSHFHTRLPCHVAVSLIIALIDIYSVFPHISWCTSKSFLSTGGWTQHPKFKTCDPSRPHAPLPSRWLTVMDDLGAWAGSDDDDDVTCVCVCRSVSLTTLTSITWRHLILHWSLVRRWWNSTSKIYHPQTFL